MRGNLLLLTPLAILLPIIFKRCNNIKFTVLVCFFVSISIEFIQYISIYVGNIRSVDIDDVILNTLGALIGVFIYQFINKNVLRIKV